MENVDSNKKRKAIFLDRDGVINYEGGELITTPGGMSIFDFAPRAIRKINNSGYLAIIITNQSVVARNLCSINVLEQIHDKMEDKLREKGATIDKIYYCPHLPDEGIAGGDPEYLIDCNCRKPKIGMIMQATQDFNIDLDKSFFIGDAERDIICGMNAGVKTIGVLTGKGLKNSKVQPDYIFNNLDEAVNFIVYKPKDS